MVAHHCPLSHFVAAGTAWLQQQCLVVVVPVAEVYVPAVPVVKGVRQSLAGQVVGQEAVVALLVQAAVVAALQGLVVQVLVVLVA